MDKFFILKPCYVCLGVLLKFLMASCLPRTLLFLQDISGASCKNTPWQSSQVAADFCLFSFQSTVSSGPGCGVDVLSVPTARFQSVLLEHSFPFENPFLSPTSLTVIHQCIPQDFSFTVLSSLNICFSLVISVSLQAVIDHSGSSCFWQNHLQWLQLR